ncbi:MAG: hypothetical protein M3044_22805 [Thermoproteota archaeon]|nr:hypothetical protein [Thermoproteota archaeon]
MIKIISVISAAIILLAASIIPAAMAHIIFHHYKQLRKLSEEMNRKMSQKA